MWEISEGDIEFMYAMNLVSQEDVGVWESKCRKLSIQVLFNFLVLVGAS